MPRLNGRVPAYRLHKATGKAIVTLDGRDYYLGPHGSPESRAEYDRLIAEWLAGGRRLSPPSGGTPADLTVTELLREFWRFAEADYRRPDGTDAPELQNLRLAIKPLKELFGPVAARDFGPLRLQALQQSLAKEKLGRRTVNQRIKRVVRVFAWAESRELIPRGQHHSLRTVPGLKAGRSEAKEIKVIRPAPDADIEAVKPHLSRQLRAVVELQQATGMRSSEVLGMRTGDIDRTGKVWIYTPRQHKGQHHGRERPIYLGPKGQEILRPWLRANPDEYLFQPREALEERSAERRHNRKTPLTPSQRARRRKARPEKTPGDHYDARAYAHAVKHACVKAGVPHWHPHQVRHGLATKLRREFGLDAAKVILGHSDMNTTMIYAEEDREKAIRVMEQVG